MSKPKIIGELVVVALKGRNLPNRELIGKQDPFCVFKVGKTTIKTKTDYRGGQHPIWDAQVNLPVPEGEKKMISQVFDDDKKKEDLIGECDVDLSTVLKDGEQDDWFPLTYRGKAAGEIYLELTFYATGSAPPQQNAQQPQQQQQIRQQGYKPLPPNPSPVPSQQQQFRTPSRNGSNPSPPVGQGGYPPVNQGGYPPAGPQGYPPVNSGYPPVNQGGYPPSGRPANLMAQNPMMSPPQQYPPQQTPTPYRPQLSSSPPQQHGYPSRPVGGAPPQHSPHIPGGYPPQPSSAVSAAFGGGYPPSGLSPGPPPAHQNHPAPLLASAYNPTPSPPQPYGAYPAPGGAALYSPQPGYTPAVTPGYAPAQPPAGGGIAQVFDPFGHQKPIGGYVSPFPEPQFAQGPPPPTGFVYPQDPSFGAYPPQQQQPVGYYPQQQYPPPH